MPKEEEGNKKHRYDYSIDTIEQKFISDYTHMSFKEIMEIDCLEYKILLKDAIVHQFEQTEEGQEYLEKCWILQQSTPDYDRLKEKYR